MEHEEPLSGGWVTEGVVRVGDTVRRPREGNAELAEMLLRRLQENEFAGAPRFCGIDEQGRQILTFIPGDVPSNTGNVIFHDHQLAAAARLLRAFHDAAGDLIHGDPGPWNMVWRDDVPVALIDFDEVRAGNPIEDVGYAAWKFLNLGIVPVLLGEQARRLRVLSNAYGMATEEVVPAIGRELDRAHTRFPNRVEFQRRWFAENGGGLI